MNALPKHLLFHERFAEPHVDAALDLTDGKERIEDLPDVVGDPNLVDADEARVAVDLELDGADGIAVGRARSDAGALVAARASFGGV